MDDLLCLFSASSKSEQTSLRAVDQLERERERELVVDNDSIQFETYYSVKLHHTEQTYRSQRCLALGRSLFCDFS